MPKSITKYVDTSPNTVKKRFVVSNDRGDLRIDFEVENALHPHNWRTEGSVLFETQDEAVDILELLGVRL